jgi:ribosomal protein S27AE
MQSDRYILNPRIHNSAEVKRLQKQGKRPLCPKCGAELIVALSIEEAKRLKSNPGMRCPKDPKHFESTIYLLPKPAYLRKKPKS